MIGAALASTDQVMLRGLLRRPGLPEAVRLALRLESGLNDIVLLPIILVAMALSSHTGFDGLNRREGSLSFCPRAGPESCGSVGVLGALEPVRCGPACAGHESLLPGCGVRRLQQPKRCMGADSSLLLCGLTIAVLDVELATAFSSTGKPRQR
jgi:hypothetical protein